MKRIKSDIQSAEAFDDAVVACRACPRLVAWRQQVAQEKTRRFAAEKYWGKPVPSFGPAGAALLIVGLAPAAHGANRTGRMFTGDRSGEWLYEQLYGFGFASAPESKHAADGLTLRNTRITAAVHCAPPGNKPVRDELTRCGGFLRAEIALCRNVRVYLALGGVAYRELLRAFGAAAPRPRPPFAHGTVVCLPGGRCIVASYHPSQQNTFTGRLTREMFRGVFQIAAEELGKNSYINQDL